MLARTSSDCAKAEPATNIRLSTPTKASSCFFISPLLREENGEPEPARPEDPVASPTVGSVLTPRTVLITVCAFYGHALCQTRRTATDYDLAAVNSLIFRDVAI